MNFYTETDFNGELWLRDSNDNVLPANQLLSSIYIKYRSTNSTFYNDLTSNIIKRFDSFYDTFFIETENGYFFEKYKIENFEIYPYNQINNYNISTKEIDYWFDENENKIFFVNTNPISNTVNPIENSALIRYSFSFNVFDIKTGRIDVLLNENLEFDVLRPENLTDLSDIKEDPKLTYNPDTNNFNISFIIRNNANKMGIISIILNEYEIKKIDAFIPFGTLRVHTEIPVSPVPTATPSPTVTPTISVTPTPTPTIQTSPTPTPTISRTPAPSPVVKTIYISFE
jgi:hypothetical protein